MWTTVLLSLFDRGKKYKQSCEGLAQVLQLGTWRFKFSFNGQDFYKLLCSVLLGKCCWWPECQDLDNLKETCWVFFTYSQSWEAGIHLLLGKLSLKKTDQKLKNILERGRNPNTGSWVRSSLFMVPSVPSAQGPCRHLTQHSPSFLNAAEEGTLLSLVNARWGNQRWAGRWRWCLSNLGDRGRLGVDRHPT